MAAEDAAVVVTLRANLKDYESALKSAVRATERAAKSAEQAVSGIGRKAQAAPIAEAFSKSAGQMANDARVLQFQLNDIFSGLASGQGIRAVQQQLGQIAQQLGGGGIGQAARSLGSAFVGMVNPINLAVVAFGLAATAAASYFADSDEAAEETAKALKKHSDELKAIKQRWGEVLPGVGKYIDEIDRLADATQKLADRQKLLADEFKEVKETVAPLHVDIAEVVDQLQTMGGTEQLQLINKLQEAFAAWREEVDHNRSGIAELTELQKLLASAGIPAATKLGEAITANIEGPIRRSIEATKELSEAFGDMQSPPFLSGIGVAPGIGIAAASAETERFEKSMGEAAGAIDAFVEHVIKAESGGDPNAKNPLSSATGAGQFIDSTWLSVFKSHFAAEAAGMSDAAILALRTNLDVSKRMIRAYATDNAEILERAGQTVSEANLQLAHFLGAGGATAILKAPRGTRAADVLPANVVSANQSILGGGATREDVLAYAEGRTRATKARKEENTALEDWLKLSQEELDLKNKQLEIDAMFWESDARRKAMMEEEKLLREGLAAATEQYGTVTDEMRAKIEAAAHAQAYANVAMGEAAEKTASAKKAAEESAKAWQQLSQQIGGVAQSAISGLVNDLRNGVEAGEAFRNMLSRILDSLIQIGIQSLFSGPGGGILGGLFGGVPGMAGGGNVSNVSGARHGKVSPLAFAGAPHMASGGIVGFGANAVPIIAHRGEVVVPNARRLAGNAMPRGGGNTYSMDNARISIDMAQTGLVAANNDDAKEFGRNVQKLVQAEMVRESRPGGLLRRPN